ncbi:hypothetical protein L083_5613 [Actinoplanes sp. N902-109]|nr:hypothetical protein L083_5613 [Actinoplanes sp. N902-109]
MNLTTGRASLNKGHESVIVSTFLRLIHFGGAGRNSMTTGDAPDAFR